MGKHVHERANPHIDTDGAVYDADTPEEQMRAVLEAIANDNIEFTIETNEDNGRTLDITKSATSTVKDSKEQLRYTQHDT